MTRTGGGLIQSGRMGVPDTPPLKPMQTTAQQPAPQASMPQQGPPQGLIQQSEPPMPQEAVQGPSQGVETQGDDINHVANNALMLLHDPEAGPEFETMIAKGPEGAAQAVTNVYTIVRQAFEERGEQIDDALAGEAANEVLQDVTDIGMATGAFPNGEADVQSFVSKAMVMLGEQYPELQQGFAEMANDAEPDDQTAGQQLGQGMLQSPQQQGQPAEQPGGYF